MISDYQGANVPELTMYDLMLAAFSIVFVGLCVWIMIKIFNKKDGAPKA